MNNEYQYPHPYPYPYGNQNQSQYQRQLRASYSRRLSHEVMTVQLPAQLQAVQVIQSSSTTNTNRTPSPPTPPKYTYRKLRYSKSQYIDRENTCRRSSIPSLPSYSVATLARYHTNNGGGKKVMAHHSGYSQLKQQHQQQLPNSGYYSQFQAQTQRHISLIPQSQSQSQSQIQTQTQTQQSQSQNPNRKMYHHPPPNSGHHHGHSASIGGSPFYQLNSPTQGGIAAPQQQTPPNSSNQFLPRRTAYYESHWPLYCADWGYSDHCNKELIAVATFTEDSSNRIQILNVDKIADPVTGVQSLDFRHTTDTVVNYPLTKLKWEPRHVGGNNNTVKMVSTSDCLKLWDYDIEGLTLNQKAALVNKSKSESIAPLTSFDWNKVNPTLVVTSSIDTTCTIWDLNTQQAKTQLIAHDSEVHDCTFATGSLDVFSSVGADGSVRVFDLRSLDHSTIIYEPQKPVPLVRVASNPFDQNILATLSADSNKIIILDIRQPGGPLATLDVHQKPVNTISWMPLPDGKSGSNSNSRHVLASGGDDCQVLLWDLTTGDTAAQYPLQSSYTDTSEINNITWNHTGDWVGAVSGRGIQGVQFNL